MIGLSGLGNGTVRDGSWIFEVIEEGIAQEIWVRI